MSASRPLQYLYGPTYFAMEWQQVLGDGCGAPVEVVSQGYFAFPSLALASFAAQAWLDRWRLMQVSVSGPCRDILGEA